MDKTLDMLASLQQLIIGLVFALLIVGVSIHRPDPLYSAAKDEIDTLQTSIEAVSEQVNTVNKQIYDNSELEASTLAWLRLHGAPQSSIPIAIVLPQEISIPDSSLDPLVTLNSQVKWADRIYRYDDSPFFLCAVDRPHLFHALDQVPGLSTRPSFAQLKVFILGATSSPGASLRCAIELQYAQSIGQLSGLRNVMLDVQTVATNIISLAPPGPHWVDLDIADTLKANGMGDFEDDSFAHLPAVQQFWKEIGDRPPAAARAFLDEKSVEDREKSKEKIEILGESLDGSLTIMLTFAVILCLMTYMLALLRQVYTQTIGNEGLIAEAQFFGIMNSAIGRFVMSLSLAVALAICCFVLLNVFPAFKEEWPGPARLVARPARIVLIVLFAAVELSLVVEVRRILKRLESGTQKEATD